VAEKVKILKGEALESGPATPGMARRQVEITEDAVMMEVRTEPGVTSGWHHHGEHRTYGFIASGKVRVEFGAGGREVLEGGPGDVFMVPPHTVHREGNPGDEEQVLQAIRIGSGPTVFNVDGPDEG
jgi:quercetin dioxygenase-like cupin family protein